MNAIPDSSRPSSTRSGWSSTTITTTSIPVFRRCSSLSWTVRREIVKNYDVDGIHLDDYFYPGTDFADEATYERYGQDFEQDR